MNTTHEQALARYNAAYDNATYRDIRRRITIDTSLNEGDAAVVDLMNTLIDTCIACCGSPLYGDAHIRLARLAAWARLSDPTLNTIYHYLLTFQQTGLTAAEDFQAIAKALTDIAAEQSRIGEAAAQANGVHSWQGRTAYHLLAAAEYLAKSAELLLDQTGSDTYLHEKLKHGLNYINSALYEGVRHADKPELFDFSNMNFPKGN